MRVEHYLTIRLSLTSSTASPERHGENRAEVGTLELALEDRYATHANDRIVEEAFKRFFELHRSEFQPV